MMLTAVVAQIVLVLYGDDLDGAVELDRLIDHQAVVHQATGMLGAQLDVPMAVALAMLRHERSPTNVRSQTWRWTSCSDGSASTRRVGTGIGRRYASRRGGCGGTRATPDADIRRAGRQPRRRVRCRGRLTTLATRTVALLSVDAAAILLGDEQEHLHVVAASGEAASLLGLFDLQATQGPALECYRSGIPQAADHLLAAISWPALGLSIAAHGFQTMDAMPMRLRSHVIGVLSLLGGSGSGLDDADLVVAQAPPTWPRSASSSTERSRTAGYLRPSSNRR